MNTDNEQKRIFSENLNYYLSKYEKTQKELADGIGVSPQLVNTWSTGKNIPRMGKIEKIANFFHIKKSDLIDAKDGFDEFGTNITELARNIGGFVIGDKNNPSDANLDIIINTYADLNEEGKERLLEYAKLLNDSQSYSKKSDTDEMVAE